MKKNIRIAIASGLLLLIFGAIFCIFNRNLKIKDWPDIEKNGRLYVLADSSSIGFSNIKGEVSGFQYEIVKAFADTLGLELAITEENNISKSISSLQSGDYDIIANFTPITSELTDKVKFSKPFFISRQVLVQLLKADSGQHKMVKKALELANDTIYISKDSAYKLRLAHLSNEIANPIVIIELKDKSTEQMVKLVAAGKIKQTICDERLAQKLKQKYPLIDISVPIGFDQHLAWMVHTESPLLLKKLNEFLSDFVGSPAYWSIYKKYY
jgi:membrane-bound lytic murein transglycosylase F